MIDNKIIRKATIALQRVDNNFRKLDRLLWYSRDKNNIKIGIRQSSSQNDIGCNLKFNTFINQDVN